MRPFRIADRSFNEHSSPPLDGVLLAQICRSWVGRACPLCPGNSDINLFRYGKGIIHLDAKIPDGAFDLRVAQQELHSS